MTKEEEYEKKEEFSAIDLKEYRKSLNFTTREFSKIFSISHRNLQRIESNKRSGKNILRLIGMYKNYPKMAYDKIKFDGRNVLSASKYVEAIIMLEIQIENDNLERFQDSIED